MGRGGLGSLVNVQPTDERQQKHVWVYARCHEWKQDIAMRANGCWVLKKSSASGGQSPAAGGQSPASGGQTGAMGMRSVGPWPHAWCSRGPRVPGGHLCMVGARNRHTRGPSIARGIQLGRMAAVPRRANNHRLSKRNQRILASDGGWAFTGMRCGGTGAVCVAMRSNGHGRAEDGRILRAIPTATPLSCRSLVATKANPMPVLWWLKSKDAELPPQSSSYSVGELRTGGCGFEDV